MKAAVLDSYALISYLERGEGYQEVARIFDECVAKDREVFLCVINWGEVIYHGFRVGGEATAKLAEDTMMALPLHVVGLDETKKDLTREAAELKAIHRISYSDCFAAALAIKKKCELVTGNREFKQLEEILKVNWIR